MKTVILSTWLCLFSLCGVAAEKDVSKIIASLIDPQKLSTLGERKANPRIQKAVYWLEMGRRSGQKPETVLDSAIKEAGYAKTSKLAADLTKDALLRNLSIAEKLGCLDEAGMDELRKGNAATVRNGPYVGQELSVDHIIPRSVVPELDNVIANLELMPEKMNSAKGAAIGQRQRDLAGRLFNAGLLSRQGLEAVRRRR